MGRRSDHSRAELRAMILTEGHRQLSEIGYARFSAREVAKRIGYTVGTLYNVFGAHDTAGLYVGPPAALRDATARDPAYAR